MFIREAYEETEWKPFIPAELKVEFEKNIRLGAFFIGLPVME